MFKKSEPLNLAEYGLITDIPSNSTALSAWSGNLNMRAKDGSVQGVYKFENSFPIDDTYNGVLDAKPISITQWTPAGTDHLNIAYIIESQKPGEVGKGRVFVYNTNTQVTAEITNADASAAFTIDPKYPPQIFVFNGLLVVNPGTGTPQYITADTTTNGNLDDLPRWVVFGQTFAEKEQVDANHFTEAEVEANALCIDSDGNTVTSETTLASCELVVAKVHQYTVSGTVIEDGSIRLRVVNDSGEDVASFGIPVTAETTSEELAVLAREETNGLVESISGTGSELLVVLTKLAGDLAFTIDSDNGISLVPSTTTTNNVAYSGAAGSWTNQQAVGDLKPTPMTDYYGDPVLFVGQVLTGAPAITRVLRPYKNRLVAMNLFNDADTSTTDDDTFHPIDLVWSSNITGLGSLTGAEWQVTTTNSAGDSFLTATPGKILDGMQLGEDFIVTKTDSVVRVYETDDNLVLGFDTLLEDDGAYSARCIANIGNSQQLIVGNFGVITHDGRGDKKDIAKGVFQDALYDAVNPVHKDLSFLFLQTRDKEVWFSFSSKANTGGGCDMAFVYEYNTGKLHMRSLPNVLDIYEAEIDGELKIFATSPDTKQILELSTTNHEAGGYFTITDKDLGDSSHTKEFDGIWINSEEEIKVGLSGNSFLKDVKDYTEVDFDPETEERIDFREDGRYFSVRFTMIGDTNPKLTNIRFSTRISGD